MLKSTARILPALFTVALGFSAALVSAQPRPNGSGSAFDRTIADQPAASNVEERRRQADDLMLRARRAMAENDLEAAYQLLTQAEALDVPYSALHLGDTPRRLRRDLEARYQAAGLQPGQPASRSQATPADPFLGRGGDPAAASGDPKTIAKANILNARTEMARNNLGGAVYYYRKAAQQPATFGPNEDSPERLAADLRRMGARPEDLEVTAGGTGPRRLPPVDAMGTPSNNPGAYSQANGERRADFLSGNDPLLEARRALAVGDTRRAAQKVQQARASGVAYNALDDSPEKVEAAIAAYSDLMAQKAERGTSEAWRRQHARLLLEQADALLRWRDYAEAERLAAEAARLRVNYTPYERRPETILDQVAAAKRQSRMASSGSGVMPASAEHVAPATGFDFDRRASSAVYDPSQDATRNVLASNREGDNAVAGQPGSAMALYQQGEAALRAHDAKAALNFFQQAYARVQELDPATARQLQDRLQLLSAAAAPPRPTANQPPMVDEVAQKQQLLARQLSAEIGLQERTAERLRESDPKGAIAALEQVKAKVASAGLDQATKDLLLRRVERQLAETKKYIEDNQSKISQEEQNRRVKQTVERDQQVRLDAQNKLAQMVDEYNTLRHEHRFPEMLVVAKRAVELDPENQVAQMMLEEAKFILNFANAMDVRSQKADGFIKALHNVDVASVPIDDTIPYVHGDAKTWKELTAKRAKYAKEQSRKLSERELEIQQKLKTPVSVQFENTPLAKVIDHLGKLAGVNFYLDPQGLAEQGVSTDSPVTIDLRNEIKLESALNLILNPLHLSYVIKDEVLKITSEQYKNVQVYTKTYYVADLVIPIPNFVPNGNLGLAGAYKDAMSNVNFGGVGPFGASSSTPLAVVASRDGRKASAAIDPTVLAQISNGSRNATPSTVPAGGPGNMGGAAMADFDSLIDLITSTIQPTTWDSVGGPGSIAPFETNLSLVVSQTQEVHEEIADLLEQLRRIQDLQVTIEVRFITLNDNFFERIGVDFDFQVNDKTDHPGMQFGRMVGVGDPPGTEPVRDIRKNVFNEFGHEHSRTVGMSAPGVFQADLDIPFSQNSFGLAVPQFGGFTPEAGMQMGFAILSEIEAFFFINAAQGDRRSNVLQAPKVTLFNGQMAFVSDTSNSPFVISVIPVVGDFAAAQQPVIVILSEGTFLTVQAVVSSDRRFVRLTVVPYFSTIGKVDTFTFTGSETSTSSSSQEGQQDQPNDNTKKANSTTTSRQGTTVQLPTYSFVTVTTTVSVPDGGTVLLGGIKRLSEGRNEFGVPILNKIPYVNRLFKNVGIGRETQSLMMMVTPRIIIQEEEEERLGIQQPPP